MLYANDIFVLRLMWNVFVERRTRLVVIGSMFRHGTYLYVYLNCGCNV